MLKAPFLKQVRLNPDRIEAGVFPFGTLAFLGEGCSLGFEAAVTFLVDLFRDLG